MAKFRVAKKYNETFGANPKIYSVNLQDYGTIMFPEKNVYALAGWSEKIFDIINLMEDDKTGIIEAINSLEL